MLAFPIPFQDGRCFPIDPPRCAKPLSRDAFTKREKANEDYVIRMREKEKLAELKKKLAEQHESLKKLEDHM